MDVLFYFVEIVKGGHGDSWGQSFTRPFIGTSSSIHTPTLKNAGLTTTQLGLFGNPALGKYRTEHMLGYFDPDGWVKCLSNMLCCFI